MATAELKVINSVLKNKDIGILFGQSVDDLFEGYGDVWTSIKGYYNKYHSVPDIDQIQERFPDLEEVAVNGESAYYLDVLRNEYLYNRLERIVLGAGKNLQPSTSPRTLEELQVKLAQLNRFTNSSRDLDVMDFDEASRNYDERRARALAHGGVPGIPTGISFIDSAYTTGLSGGDLIILLGWTGRAKSLLATLICCNAHDQNRKPLFASLEMSGEKVRDRIYTIKGSGLFTHSGLALGDVDVDDFRTFSSRYKASPSFIVVTNDGNAELTPNMMQAKIDQHRPDIVVLDYAQLAMDNENSNDMIARMRNMSRQYKRLAVRNDIPVILISSATADTVADTTKPPVIEQVAWSKQLSFDAELSFAGHKHDDSNIIELVGRKNRNGPLFSGYLDWDIDRGVIEEKFDI